MRIDWEQARHKYIYGHCSYQEIANEFKVSLRSVERQAAKGGWVKEKEKYVGEVAGECRRNAVKLGAEFIAALNEDAWAAEKKLREDLNLPEPLSPQDIRAATGSLLNLRMMVSEKEDDKEIVVRFVGYEGAGTAEPEDDGGRYRG